MSFGTDIVAGGTTGSLPDVAVASDQIAGAKYQRLKLADPNADQTGAYGIDSNPMRVRPRRQGTADYDSGSVAVASAITAVTTATVYVEGILLVNLTSQVQNVDLTDTAGAEILKAFPLQANETRVIPAVGGMPLVGIKAGAGGNAGAVRARIWGTQ